VGKGVRSDALRTALKTKAADVVALVHAETSTGVLNPVQQLAAIARDHGALTIVDAVTSFGGHPLDVGGWGIDACYSCTQKSLGGHAASRRSSSPARPREAREVPQLLLRSRPARGLLDPPQVHHTMSSTLVCAIDEALAIVEEEGLEARWARHERNHRALVASLSALGLSVLTARRRAALGR